MIVAVIPVGGVQATVHQVIDMVPVGYCLVAATGAVDMAWLVTRQGLPCGARIGIGAVHTKDMFIDMVPVRMVQVPIVQVVNVSVMVNGGVTAAGSVIVIMAFVDCAA